MKRQTNHVVVDDAFPFVTFRRLGNLDTSTDIDSHVFRLDSLFQSTRFGVRTTTTEERRGFDTVVTDFLLETIDNGNTVNVLLLRLLFLGLLLVGCFFAELLRFFTLLECKVINGFEVALRELLDDLVLHTRKGESEKKIRRRRVKGNEIMRRKSRADLAGLFENASEILEEVLIEHGIFHVGAIQHCSIERRNFLFFRQELNGSIVIEHLDAVRFVSRREQHAIMLQSGPLGFTNFTIPPFVGTLRKGMTKKETSGNKKISLKEYGKKKQSQTMVATRGLISLRTSYSSKE
jgi:hypothetical protein